MTQPDPPTTGPSDETKAGFKALFAEAMNEWYKGKQDELAQQPPPRTEKPKSFLDDILNFGKSS